MNDIDFERAAVLMDVMAKVVNVAPHNQSILGEAGQELSVIEAECRENALERAEERKANEVDRDTEAQAKLRDAQGDALDGPQPEDPNVVLEDPEPKPAPTKTLRRP